ncbi:MAG TPA: radical SAM protein [Firmicutes bacterium]|nr:radical SAM protein [Bacillota bacterium]
MGRTKNPEQLKLVLIDGYLDEPSCLGVPPYISPHVRYAYGALLDLGISADSITFATIDQVRQRWSYYLDAARGADAVIIIAGVTVPGRYLGGRPISKREISELGAAVKPVPVILGGPITLCGEDIPGVSITCGEIAAVSLQEIFGGRPAPGRGVPEEWAGRIARFAVLGAELTTRHPSFPHIVCELETYRGCPRRVNCSFCSEGRKRVLYQRRVEDIVAEVKALSGLGNRYFRLGCQSDLFLYGAEARDGRLYPQPTVLRELYQGIRQAAPDLKVLHMDNANPASIMRDPELGAEVIDIICRHNTPGDVAAFGLESADPSVLAANRVETTPEETFAAVRLMNEIGGRREQGIPKLLPGINLLHGLQGETPKTLEINLQYLHRLMDEGLMVRRINIRQVLPVGGYKPVPIDPHRFQAYKERVNEEINKPMLQRVFPKGTLLREVRIEEVKGQVSFGRQLGSYPILVGIPGEIPVGTILDVGIIDHGYRSITGLPVPFYVNKASIAQLAAIPGMGRKRATRVFLAQPVRDIQHLEQVLEGQVDFSPIARWLDFTVQ